MTPFGRRVRELRRQKGVRLKDMAAELQLSPAYLSALEHGHRGRPSPILVEQICGFFNIIWDEADDLRRLAELSHPRAVIDTAGLSPEATLLAERIGALPEKTIARLLSEIGTEDDAV
jgi:transcriptional regulator with XRE-family HTH domain